MKNFTCAYDVPDVPALIREAIQLKKDPFAFSSLGKNKTIGLIFMNPSLRTRMSTQKAAQLLGMNILSVNTTTEGWALETNDGVMNGTTVEHIEEAAAVMGEYCDIIGVRSFPSLSDKLQDTNEKNLLQWMKYSGKPVLSLESATRHPLQSLADMMTIAENKKNKKMKIVLTWAPHVKAVPHAVANSFCEWMKFSEEEFVITHPHGLELDEEFSSAGKIEYDQEKALEDADLVYVKSWCSFSDYGKLQEGNKEWMITPEKLAHTNEAKVMHCLPVRRDVELASSILKSSTSLHLQQAANRVPAAQIVLKKMITSMNKEIKHSSDEFIHAI
ncbi:MAG: acetylornithine carbamoyltransferase [Bacteroidetes bacterium]|nr:acetylornithine carbamoyltransferase [Bacteroidota bacterium]